MARFESVYPDRLFSSAAVAATCSGVGFGIGMFHLRQPIARIFDVGGRMFQHNLAVSLGRLIVIELSKLRLGRLREA